MELKLCDKKLKRRRVACVICETFLSYHQLPLLAPPSPFFLTSQCPDLIEIRFKREKKRKEEKKKDSSSLHDDLVQIPSDLHERVRTVIYFFKIWKKRSRSMDEEQDL